MGSPDRLPPIGSSIRHLPLFSLVLVRCSGKTDSRRPCTKRVMLVEAAWSAAKTPGPLHAFFVRIRAKRGHQVAAVALARKLTVLCWHLLTKQANYRSTRPAVVANMRRAMELKAGRPQRKGISQAQPMSTTSRNCVMRK